MPLNILLIGYSSERYNRTQKSKLYRYFTSRGNHKWIDVLEDLTHGYNNTVHSSTKFKPIEVNRGNEAEVRKNLYPPIPPPGKPKFSLNDTVRISRKGNIFRKGFKETYTHEIFTVAKINKTNPITYTLKDFQDELIQGSFYEREMTRVRKLPDAVYPVETIIKRKRTPQGVQLYVKWLGYSSAANSWISESELYPINAN